MVRYVQFLEEEARMELSLLATLKREGITKCEMTDFLLFVEFLYLSAAGERCGS